MGLKEERQRAGLSQSQLAARSGVNIRMISYYEQDVKDISKAAAITVYHIAKALGCTVEDILEVDK